MCPNSSFARYFLLFYSYAFVGAGRLHVPWLLSAGQRQSAAVDSLLPHVGGEL